MVFGHSPERHKSRESSAGSKLEKSFSSSVLSFKFFKHEKKEKNHEPDIRSDVLKKSYKAASRNELSENTNLDTTLKEALNPRDSETISVLQLSDNDSEVEKVQLVAIFN